MDAKTQAAALGGPATDRPGNGEDVVIADATPEADPVAIHSSEVERRPALG